MEISQRSTWSDIGGADYAGPFLAIIHQVFAKVSRRTRKHGIAKFRQAVLEIWIGDHEVDFFIKL
jgi:hypothetical protein